MNFGWDNPTYRDRSHRPKDRREQLEDIFNEIGGWSAFERSPGDYVVVNRMKPFKITDGPLSFEEGNKPVEVEEFVFHRSMCMCGRDTWWFVDCENYTIGQPIREM